MKQVIARVDEATHLALKEWAKSKRRSLGSSVAVILETWAKRANSSPTAGNNDVATAEGYAIDDDDMHWQVNCPRCDKLYEYRGYYDSTEKTNCACGCTFTTGKVYFSDETFMI